MGLRGWYVGRGAGPAGVGDRPLLGALEAALPDPAVEPAIARTAPAGSAAGCSRRTWW